MVGANLFCQVYPLRGKRVGRVVGIDKDKIVLDVLRYEMTEDRFQLASVIEIRLQSCWNFFQRDIVIAIRSYPSLQEDFFFNRVFSLISDLASDELTLIEILMRRRRLWQGH